MQRQISNTNKKRELQKRSPNHTAHVSGKLSHKPGANMQKLFEITSKSGNVEQKKQEISNHLLMESEKILSQCDSRIKTAHSVITVVYTILGIIVICLGLSSVLNYTMLKERADFFIAQIKSQGESAITEFKAKGNFAISEEKMAIASSVAESIKTGQSISQETLASAKSTVMLASNSDTLESAAVVLESNDEYYSSYLIWSMILDEKWDDDVALIAIHNAIFAIDNKEMPKSKKQQLALDAVYLSQKLVNKDQSNMSFMKAYMLSQKSMLDLESNPAIRMNIQKNTERFILEKIVFLESFIDCFCFYIETITSIDYTKSIQEKENVFYTAESSLLKFMKLYPDNEKLISSYIQLKVAMLPLLKTVQEKRELLERLDDLRRGMDKSLNSRDAIKLKVKLAEYTTDPEKRADLLHEAEALASEALRSSSEDKTPLTLGTLELRILYDDIKERMVEYAATPQERDALLREAEGRLAEAVRRSPDDADVLYSYAKIKEKMADCVGLSQERDALLREAEGHLAEAVRRSPDDDYVFYSYADLKAKMAEHAGSSQERDALLREAEGHIVEALRRSPDDAYVLCGYANLKTKMAAYAATPQERDTLLREAEDQLAEALRRSPDNASVLYSYVDLKETMAEYAGSSQERNALLREAEGHLVEVLQRFPSEIAAFYNYADLKETMAEYAGSSQERLALLREALGQLAEVLRRSPDDAFVLYRYAELKAQMAEHAATPQERDALLREAEGLLDDALRRSPDNVGVLFGGIGLKARQADLAATPQERDSLLREAEGLFGEAVRRFPDDARVLFVGARLKARLAEHAATPQARDALLREAEGLLAEAMRRFPDDVAVLSIGALIKTKLAEYAATPQERDGLLREAEGHLAAAVRCAPTNVDVLIDRAIFRAVAVQYADTPQERDALLCEAKELLKKIPLRNPRMLLKVARLEVELAKYAVPQERKTLLGNAEMHIKQSGQEDFPQLYYVKSCIAALRGQQERALELLEECRKAGTLPPREHLEKDKDMDSLRDLDAFREFLKRAYPDQPDDQADAPA